MVIVGAGPVGLFTVFECGMVRLSCHVVDVLDGRGPGGVRAAARRLAEDAYSTAHLAKLVA